MPELRLFSAASDLAKRPVLRLAFLSRAGEVKEDHCALCVATWLAFHSERYRCELYTPARYPAEKLACQVAACLELPCFVCCRAVGNEAYFNLHFPVLGIYLAQPLLPIGLRQARYEILT